MCTSVLRPLTGMSLRVGLMGLLCLVSVKSDARIVRGDVDLNLELDIGDPVVILFHLFLGTHELPCRILGDANSDGLLDVADPIELLAYLFLGSDRPATLSPFEERLCLQADPAQIERGMLIYEEPEAGASTFACATCHNLIPDGEAALRRPAHSLHDALWRPSYKNGQLDPFIEAANVCRRDWMVTEPWEETDAAFLDLVSFLRGASTVRDADALAFQVVPPTHSGPAQGDPDAGCELFHTTCVVCHGDGAQGTERAPSLVFSPEVPLNADYIRRRVRLSGNPDSVYEGLTGGVMPFWSADKLSDGELEDLVSFVTARPVPACRDVDPGPDERVLRSGDLMTRAHGVAGTVEELDSRRIRIRAFHFDGVGEDVRLWLYSGDNVNAGLSLGDNLVRAAPGWVDETLLVDIPDEFSMDAYDHLAVRSLNDGEIYGVCPLERPGNGDEDGTVLRRGALMTRFHGVVGTVEELDTRKIRIRDFNFDGGGIVVKVWLYRSGEASQGYAIGPDLVRPFPGWENETLVIDIPDPITADMYDSVSIWCVAVRVSFGDTALGAVE